jgi:putative endonuclease
MFFVYVLRSAATGRHYVGFCADLAQRLGQHNAGLTKSTKNRGPWELVYQEEWPTRAEAMGRERYWKSGQGREKLKRLLGERGQGAAE